MKKLILMVCLGILSSAVVLSEDAPMGDGDKPAGKAGGGKGGKRHMEKGEKIEVSAIPAEVKDAATKEVAGFEATSAETVKKDDATIYRLFGKANDKEYVVIVDSTGKVLKSFEKGKGFGKGPHSKKKGEADKEEKAE